jgi:hypothetical protein
MPYNFSHFVNAEKIRVPARLPPAKRQDGLESTVSIPNAHSFNTRLAFIPSRCAFVSVRRRLPDRLNPIFFIRSSLFIVSA